MTEVIKTRVATREYRSNWDTTFKHTTPSGKTIPCTWQGCVYPGTKDECEGCPAPKAKRGKRTP